MCLATGVLDGKRRGVAGWLRVLRNRSSVSTVLVARAMTRQVTRMATPPRNPEKPRDIVFEISLTESERRRIVRAVGKCPLSRWVLESLLAIADRTTKSPRPVSQEKGKASPRKKPEIRHAISLYVRLTDSERKQLVRAAGGNPLAAWIRETLLAIVGRGHHGRRRSWSTDAVAPVVARQTAGVASRPKKAALVQRRNVRIGVTESERNQLRRAAGTVPLSRWAKGELLSPAILTAPPAERRAMRGYRIRVRLTESERRRLLQAAGNAALIPWAREKLLAIVDRAEQQSSRVSAGKRKTAK